MAVVRGQRKWPNATSDSTVRAIFVEIRENPHQSWASARACFLSKKAWDSINGDESAAASEREQRSGEEKAGVREGGSAKARDERPHADRQGLDLQHCLAEGPRGLSAPPPHPHRRVPHRRRNSYHPLHRSQRSRSQTLAFSLCVSVYIIYAIVCTEMIGYSMNAFGNFLLGLKFLHFVSWVWPIYICWFGSLYFLILGLR